jgi:alkylation response protein AidB-like acyl-CoA dehydrogenase
MNLALDDDQIAVRDLFATFFERESPIAVVRETEALGFAPDLWTRLAETGAPDMALAEGGAGLCDMTLVIEEAGRHLAPVPLVEHVVATRLLESVGVSVESDEPVTLGLRPASGVATMVPAGAVAGHVVVLDVDGQLVLISSPPPGRAEPNYAGLPLADRAIAGAVVAQDGRAVHGRAVDEWRVLMASMLVGLADAALKLGVNYVKERHQFGVPIGTFQAIQHGLAELPGQISGARLLASRTAWRADAGLPIDHDAPMALLFAAELARLVTTRVLHFLGGYGAMVEYDAQLHYRRAKGWPAQLDDPAREVNRLAALLYGPADGIL